MDRLDKIIKIMMNEYNANCGEECEGCIYYDGDCNIDYLIEMLFKWDKTFKKEKSITLKNVDIGNITVGEQRNKVIEDRKEFTNTALDYFFYYDGKEETTEKCKEKAIEAFWKMVQAGIGLLQKIDVDVEEIMEYYNKNLDNRGRK